MRYWGTLVTVGAAVLLAGCGAKSASEAQSAFPPDEEAQGWKIERPVRSFSADNLWEYIDGDAEKYLQKGFENVQNGAYKYKGKVEAAADVYVMKTAEAATAILSGEADQGSQPCTLGDGGKMYRGSIVFRKGRRVIRLIAYQDEPETQPALVELGRAIAKRLEGRN